MEVRECVSILSPHQHGLQLPASMSFGAGITFQSSARINTGCNALGLSRAFGLGGFQSSARINTGCNVQANARRAAARVSILSPHQHGLQPAAGLETKRHGGVSILSPHQHGLQQREGGDAADGPQFQSSARINTGCNGNPLLRRGLREFQSSARINTGCNWRNCRLSGLHGFQSSARINTGCNGVSRT